MMQGFRPRRAYGVHNGSVLQMSKRFYGVPTEQDAFHYRSNNILKDKGLSERII